MYDGYSWESLLDLPDPMDDMFCLDSDKPFVMNLTDEELMDIAEQGFDRWLMGLAGIL